MADQQVKPESKPEVKDTPQPEGAVVEEQQVVEQTPEQDVADETKVEGQETVKAEETDKPEAETPKTKVGQLTSLIEDAGLNMKDVAEYAKANEGKVDLETLVALKEKHGEAIADIIASQVTALHKERTAEAQQRDQAVYDQVEKAFEGLTEQSGEESWKELAGWAKDNVATEDRKEINALLAQGGLASKLAVQELVSAFKESQGTQEYQEADLETGDTTTNPSSGGTISKSDYNRELDALLASGHIYGESKEIAKLDARRSKSIRLGV